MWNKDEDKKDEKNKSNELENYFYLNNGNNSIYKTFQFLIEGEYKICVYGAKALEGGKGGVQCAEHYFEKNDTLEFYLEGRKSGGKGGVNCGKIETKNGYDGAGLAKVIRLNYSDFELVAGGGGGSCESGNKGGDYERDGEDEKGGKGATNTSGGEKGDWDATDGIQYKGGNGGRTDRDDKFCGGGGGNGYFGGGGGGYGSKIHCGGGGGGSNFCKANICHSSYINNEKDYSGYKIFKKNDTNI